MEGVEESGQGWGSCVEWDGVRGMSGRRKLREVEVE